MNDTIDRAAAWAWDFFQSDSTGHDYHHTKRVASRAVRLAREEEADAGICALAAWLHDIADDKFYHTKGEGAEDVVSFLRSEQLSTESIQAIMEIIDTVSYKGGFNRDPETLEGQIVRDADRLDALGAVGTARTFMFAGAHNSSMHRPGDPLERELDQHAYERRDGSAVQHFYEKLFKLKEGISTASGRREALVLENRMTVFLEWFFEEWEQKAD
ncbi:HD domain-containing protein [Alkalicoccus chagannorensis]|uniref:HD domain-containing protein n=1 Tax=Alkalicoccus chagannorensis TaxID=427072 RepID=UPI00041F0E78|nr:HD domain-containing protein [Alkalicoccus chagannorensis]